MSLPWWLALPAATLAALGDGAVAQVGAREISAVALEERVAAYRAAGSRISARDALEDLVNDALLAAEAERQGLGKNPAIAAEVEGERRHLAAEHLLEREVLPAAAVDEAGLRRLFHMGSDTARVRLLVYATQAEAGAAAGRLRGDPDFAREAPRALRGASSPGGDLGVRARGQLDPVLAEAAFSAPIGAVLGPLRLELGWGVAKVLERHLGDDAEFRERRESLRAFAEAQARAMVKDHYLGRLRQAARVEIDQAFLDGLGTRIEPTPEEAEHVLATVAGRPLRYRDILPQVLRLSRGKTGGHLSGPRVKGGVAGAEVDRLLLEAEAARRGHAADPAVAAAADRYREVALARALSTAIRRNARPSEDDARAYYREHRAEYRPAPFEEARAAILARLEAERGDAAVRDRIASLRAGTTIAVDERAFGTAAARLDAAGAPPQKKEAP